MLWTLRASSAGTKSFSITVPRTEEEQPLKTKRKGNRNEYKSMRLHELAGAYCVRSGGSLGLWDFVAIYPTTLLLVQVKSNRWPGHDEVQALSQFVPPHYGRKVVERWDDYARSPLVREVP